MIELIINGQPVSKGRPRVMNHHAFTPLKTVNYETLIKELFIISKQKKIEGMVYADIKCFFSIPKSTSKKNRELMLSMNLRPTKKPDSDNLAKICLDALNDLAYDDDSQVVELSVSKWYSDIPKVVIHLYEV